VPRKKKALCAKLVCDGHDVRYKVWHGVVGDPKRLATHVVAALVRDNHAESRSSQWKNLVTPRVPELWETMQQNDERCIHWTGGNSMQVNVSHFEVEVFERVLIHASCRFQS
jgi:hypothetical protein